MISQIHRFTGHRSVARVRSKPIYGLGFRLYSMENKKDDFRFAVVVSKKIAKSAVVRNRIRRRIYEAIRKDAALNGRSIDVVCVVQDATIGTMDATVLQNSLREACQKVLQTN